MKNKVQFTIDSRGFAVAIICCLAVVGVFVQYFWNFEGPNNIDVLMFIFGISAVLLNRLFPPSDKMARPQLRILRLVTESFFTIGLVGAIAWWVFYETSFNFFELLMMPSIILAIYLLIKFGFKPNDRDGETTP